MTDELLVTRAQLGERAALAQLVARWRMPVWTYVRRMLDAERADDVAQEVWLAVVRGLPRLREPGRFAPWLFTIARRSVTDRLSPVLSLRTRIRAVAALLAGVAGAVFMGTLWWTEPGPLPGRTHLAFALLTVFCLVWAAYGGWLLTRRIPLFATDQVFGWCSPSS
ncbi:RNA polymerase sigma factor [Microbispora sp. H10670]|uniref:RNA polymerase sigma factor n=1 Tax=Microbispora sp. H10670 TaxID=2729108 RepID=UPI001602A7FE|nr:sigma factor [Microbispora sp. H10670]